MFMFTLAHSVFLHVVPWAFTFGHSVGLHVLEGGARAAIYEKGRIDGVLTEYSRDWCMCSCSV